MKSKIKYLFMGFIISLIVTAVLASVMAFQPNQVRSDKVVVIRICTTKDISNDPNITKYTSVGYRINSVSCGDNQISIHLVK